MSEELFGLICLGFVLFGLGVVVGIVLSAWLDYKIGETGDR